LLSEKISELQATQASPIAINHRLIEARIRPNGSNNFGIARKNIGTKQTIVLIVHAENVARPCRFRIIFLGNGAIPGHA